jgi:hypothetical protein
MNILYEVFMVVGIEIEVFWVVTLCGHVGGYRHFSGTRCLVILQGGTEQDENVARSYEKGDPFHPFRITWPYLTLLTLILKVEAATSSEALSSAYKTAWSHKP